MIEIFRNLFAPPRHLILLVIASWIGLILSEKRAARFKVNTEAIDNVVFYGVIFYFVSGRIIYALEYYSAFAQNPQSLISLNVNLFDPFAAFVAAIFFSIIYGRAEKLSLWSALDSLTPFFATLTIGLALAHLAAGTAYGKPTDLPWGINLWGATRHPTQIYELIASLITFVLIWFQKTDFPRGLPFLTFTALTAGYRLFLETFRADSATVFGGFHTVQIIAWIVLAISLLACESIRKK